MSHHDDRVEEILSRMETELDYAMSVLDIFEARAAELQMVKQRMDRMVRQARELRNQLKDEAAVRGAGG